MAENQEKNYRITELISQERLEQRIKELAEEISANHQGQVVHLICILKGGAFFMTQLSKYMTIPVTVGFMSVSSYGSGTVSSGVVKIMKDLDDSIEGRHVVVVEDIIDTGNTLSYLLELLNWRYGDTFYMILWLLLFFARAVCSENRKTCLTEAVLAVLGSCVIFIFFLEKGRIPLRILDNILFCLCFSLMRPLKSRLSQNWQKNSALCMTAALSVAIILTVKNCDFSSPQWALTANRGNTDIREELLIEGNEVFVWEDYSNVFTPYSLEGKIPPRAVARRHVPKGVWYHNQPYYMKMLASLKISNPAEALLEREETYYVSNDPSFLLSFLREHYGSNICCEQVGRILEIPYWRFQR